MFILRFLAELIRNFAEPCLVNTALDFATDVHAKFLWTQNLGLITKICNDDTFLLRAEASKIQEKLIFRDTITPQITHCSPVRNLTYKLQIYLWSLPFKYGFSHVLRNFGKAPQNKVPSHLYANIIRHFHRYSFRDWTKENQLWYSKGVRLACFLNKPCCGISVMYMVRTSYRRISLRHNLSRKCRKVVKFVYITHSERNIWNGPIVATAISRGKRKPVLEGNGYLTDRA
jgi:hypothetical protein